MQTNCMKRIINDLEPYLNFNTSVLEMSNTKINNVK
ncbi:hypothetical protein KL86DYS2_10174 [uncultured Dysgonomonas sp.]|uniref:Uncharacterized protein n=1 Tax=uncultured Dysgonomonas sp. TaxID=206096 RepID=A0A212IVY5_9BACT|nr:hypothetical protein KL86DYS2_10174 [uncultured Dysgonomonas sp.]